MSNKIEIKPVKNVKDLRLVWTNEATDFTPWLADNIDVLSAELGLSLEVIETESSVGDFSLDILAQDSNTDNYAVIEASVGKSLDWNRCDENKISRIRIEHSSDLQDSIKKKESFDWLVKYALLFKTAFGDVIAEKA